MNNRKPKYIKYIPVKIDQETLDRLKELTKQYNCKLSALIRAMILASLDKKE